MRLSTLSLVSAFLWVFAAGEALGDSPEFDVRGDVVSEQPAALEVAPPVSQAVAVESAPVVDSESVAGDAIVDLDESAAPTPAPQAPASQSAAASSSIPLGPVGIDENGVKGRIHTVAKGDTLWDISDAYLGTPWVWPGIWHENGKIENPHIIMPGDRIWITSNEMRRVSQGQAEKMIAAMPVTDVHAESQDLARSELAEDKSLADEEAQPAAIEDGSASLPDDPSVGMTGEIVSLPFEQIAHFSGLDAMGRVSQIVESPSLREFLTQGDEVYLPLGEGEVSAGDEFTIFRDIEEVRDVGSGSVIGYHFEQRGWIEITSVKGEASTGVINEATTEVQRGDRLIPRIEKPRDIPVRRASGDVEASIVFLPGNRWLVGSTDSVYLNVGSLHGIEVGTEMEVYEAGQVRDSNKMPDTVVARMLVISVEPQTCVAFVTQTVRELEVGEHVRSVTNGQFAVR
ncbi:MAG: LysM peptidoglycan-binding domain-containing protein [Myxococcota bacterium]|nr:LysM peptidoglycan-binding domain-containing protein [Myxococcota bacterium]